MLAPLAEAESAVFAMMEARSKILILLLRTQRARLQHQCWQGGAATSRMLRLNNFNHLELCQIISWSSYSRKGEESIVSQGEVACEIGGRSQRLASSAVTPQHLNLDIVGKKNILELYMHLEKSITCGAIYLVYTTS